MIQAVLTGDIVNSTLLNEAKEKKLASSLRELYTDHKMEFFRGDSFQAYIKDPKQALRLALMSRSLTISLFKDDTTVSDIRISIGLGTVHVPVRSLNTARGEAFILSGRSFDDISKSGQRLAIAISHPIANEGMQVIADYLNAIFEGMTGKQAEVIFELLKGEMQKSVARKLKKTKSTIHQRMVAGRWPEMEKLLQQYENIINLLI
jgi:hypothetical protein